MKEHRYETHHVNWWGIQIVFTYERNWLSTEGYSPCHLTPTSDTPTRCRLPVTETGFLSHFTDPKLVEDAGGAVAYTIAELDAASKSQNWLDLEMEVLQMALC